MRLQIADVDFLIRSVLPVTFEDPDGNYASFLPPSEPADGAIPVRVDLLPGRVPDLSAMERRFECGSWTLYADGGRRHIIWKGPGRTPPLWGAELAADLLHVTVRCGPRFVREREGRRTICCPVRYPLDQILLMYVLSDWDGLLFHAAGIVLDGAGLLFAGHSGAGKSTLMGLWTQASRADVWESGADGERARGPTILSDDRIAVRRTQGGYRMFGTPWAGELGHAVNRSAVLDRFFLLRKAERNEIVPLSRTEAMERLLPVSSILWHELEKVPRMLSFCEELVSSVPVFEFRFRPEREAVEMLCEAAPGMRNHREPSETA